MNWLSLFIAIGTLLGTAAFVLVDSVPATGRISSRIGLRRN
jgi:hypothetical protein